MLRSALALSALLALACQTKSEQPAKKADPPAIPPPMATAPPLELVVPHHAVPAGARTMNGLNIRAPGDHLAATYCFSSNFPESLKAIVDSLTAGGWSQPAVDDGAITSSREQLRLSVKLAPHAGSEDLTVLCGVAKPLVATYEVRTTLRPPQ